MSNRGTFREGNTIYLDDAHGWPTHIPATRIPELLGEAKKSDEARARFGLRWFDRDVLQGAFDLLVVCDNCDDAPGVQDMGDGRLFCPECCSAAAGSRYDDRMEA